MSDRTDTRRSTDVDAPTAAAFAAAASAIVAAAQRREVRALDQLVTAAAAVTCDAPVPALSEAAGDLLDGILLAPDPRPWLRAVMASDLGAVLYPELAALDMEVPAGVRHKDNLDHSIRVAANTPQRRTVRWAGLCHDLGKPQTRRIVGNDVTFQGHEAVGAAVTRRFMDRLRRPAPLRDDVALIVRVSGRGADYDDSWTDAAVRRFVTDCAGLFDEACWLLRADCTSRFPDRRRAAHRRVDALRARAAAIAVADAERARRPVLDGADIMRILGIGPGPVIGEARAFVKALTANGEAVSVAAAAEQLVAWYRARTAT